MTTEKKRPDEHNASHPRLKREIGLWGAIGMGLGSIVGTGVFVSLGLAAGIAGPAFLISIAIGACVALFNGLSSAQLAANHPVSGGSYEYGYRYLHPGLGFLAGWTFLCAKTASAATAALGFAGYLREALSLPSAWRTPMALMIVLILTVVVYSGLKRSNRFNTLLIALALFALLAFSAVGLYFGLVQQKGISHFSPFFVLPSVSAPSMWEMWTAILHASALLFVAYTGYGRIATLGEEVHHPERTIPRAILLALGLVMLLYLAIGVSSLFLADAHTLGQAARMGAPLESIAKQTGVTGLSLLMTIGALCAMLGVILNLILGLSRVLLAMGRRYDMPVWMSCLNETQTTPTVATLTTGAVICLLIFIGDIKTTWSFSAFSVLIYYAITNLAALRLDDAARRYPRIFTYGGLLSCLLLLPWIEHAILYAAFILGSSVLWWFLVRRAFRPPTENTPEARSLN